MTGFIPDDAVTDHAFEGNGETWAPSCQFVYVPAGDTEMEICGRQRMEHANPGNVLADSLVTTDPHAYVGNGTDDCGFTADNPGYPNSPRRCGYPEREHRVARTNLPVRVADVAQYAREPMPDAARGGITVTLIDAPVDPLGTLAAVCGMYKGNVVRSKSDVTDDMRREAWANMRKTVLSGPLETMQFTFLIEGIDRATTHQLVRNRFSFVAQESLRFAVAEDWAAEVALPPGLLGRKEDDPLVAMWRRGLNAAEDTYGALVAAGMPAEEARGLLPHAIPTRLFWTMSMRSVLLEAGKRTCTQAQFPWRVLFAGIAKALRERAKMDMGGPHPEMVTGYKDARGDKYYTNESVQKLLEYNRPEDILVEEFTFLGDPDNPEGVGGDRWQYELFAEAIEPVCYQTGRCGFKAEFDRACSIRERVDANEKAGRPSSEWHTEADLGMPRWTENDPVPWARRSDGHSVIPAINRAEWLTDPSAARVRGEG